MENFFVRPQFDAEKAVVSFVPGRKYTAVDFKVLEGDSFLSKGTADLYDCNDKIKFDIPMKGFKPWSVETPFLYTLVVTCQTDHGIIEKTQTFGMTKINVSEQRIYFNNSPLYIRGFIRGREAHDHPNFLGSSDKEYYEKNILMAKEYGFNFIRFHSRIPDDDFLEAADRLGMLCQVEIRPYYGKYQKERESTGFDGDQQLVAESDWKKMLYRLRNHPSILIYCMGNEINSPGNNERVKIIHSITKRIDPSRLFLDTCSRGQYDRSTVDLDVQHMSYFAPFGKNYNMFNDSIHLSIYGSVDKKDMQTFSQGTMESSANTKRQICLDKPLLAHEICHYNLLRDPYKLKDKFTKHSIPKPWWIDELIKMIETKGYQQQYDTMLHASTHFYYIWLKQCIESARRSPLLQGFHFLQLSDTDRYENANGLLDCFDDPKNIPAEKVRKFNDSCILLADLPKRTFWEKQKTSIPVKLSNYDPKIKGSFDFKWSLEEKESGEILLSGFMGDFDLESDGLMDICRIEVKFPETDKPVSMRFNCELMAKNSLSINNNWDLWLFPDRANLQLKEACIKAKTVNFAVRYPELESKKQADIMIADSFTEDVFGHLAKGGDVLMLYRVDENRDRTVSYEKYYLPSTWDRFKGVIWDRGHNCGGFTRDHCITEKFPCNRYVDWQFYNLIEDCDKISLDDFPVKVEPIIEGIDKAARDRFDVGRFDLSEFQYGWTMRKFAYIFELKVGPGRLLVTGFNLKGIEKGVPESCWMFETMINYMASGDFIPDTEIGIECLKEYLLKKGNSKRIKERMMTQYWQLDNEPLESKQYWKESEEWLRANDH